MVRPFLTLYHTYNLIKIKGKMNTKQKIFNVMRTALTETTSKDINHEMQVEKEANIKMANAKKKWLIEYQAEREKKREYIRENVNAKGLDSSKLLAKLQKSKGTSSNIYY